MARTGIVTDDLFLDHDTGPGHPERAERLQAVGDWLRREARAGWVPITARDASIEELERVHVPEHVRAVAATAGRARASFDADTPTSTGSWSAARRAAGALLGAVDAVIAGEIDNGFAFVRPPGHHAEADRAMGFCLLNNVAIAAAHLRARHGLERVLILDWDVHHGNGTQHSFFSDPSVMFISSHQFPYYPGTGSSREVGTGEGEGYTLNLPFPAGCGDNEYLTSYLDIVEPVARAFRPEFILVSAGFDGHHRDPLAGMNLTEEGFAGLARLVSRVAHDVCGGRIAAVLEGGYDLVGLTRSVAAVLGEFDQERLHEPITPGNSRQPAGITTSLEIAKHYWGI
jgi:acetoin utilization deacetylase AcuC-like enzyme